MQTNQENARRLQDMIAAHKKEIDAVVAAKATMGKEDMAAAVARLKEQKAAIAKMQTRVSSAVAVAKHAVAATLQAPAASASHPPARRPFPAASAGVGVRLKASDMAAHSTVRNTGAALASGQASTGSGSDAVFDSAADDASLHEPGTEQATAVVADNDGGANSMLFITGSDD
jgi:hypothetical protein